VIRHLFKLIWNRKRANALVIAEIFVCFLVLFAVTTLSLYSWTNYHRPLGFDYANVFSVDVQFEESKGDGGNTSRVGAAAGDEAAPLENPYESRQRALLDLVKSDPSVLNAAWASPLPFSHSNEGRTFNFRKRSIHYSMARCTDEYKDVMGLEITRGRWFGPEDDGGGYEPMVISEALAKHAFGDEDPVGQRLNGDTDADGGNGIERRVVGVMRAFKQEGEMETDEHYLLQRIPYQSRAMRRMGSLALRMKPGSDAAVEARIAKALEAAAPDWSFKVEPMVMGADFNRRLFMAPIGVSALVALFLILMVALGLSGVLWQSVTTRIREIGVRRALGASAISVKWQVIGELMVMATIAMLGGVVVILQFPFLDLLGPVPSSVFFAGLSLTIVALYGLALVCGLHPARLATTVHPAEALRYE
jgi:putative ABC transport system permease protein